MAASPNPLQGSLLKSEETSFEIDTDENKSPNLSSEKLKDEELKSDAQLRPRSKKTKKNPTPVNNLEGLSIPEIEEPKWAHHSLPNIEDLTPALKYYVELKIENPDRVLLYRLGDFFECFFEDAITLSELLELTLPVKKQEKRLAESQWL